MFVWVMENENALGVSDINPYISSCKWVLNPDQRINPDQFAFNTGKFISICLGRLTIFNDPQSTYPIGLLLTRDGPSSRTRIN